MSLSFAIIYILFIVNTLLASAAYAMKLKKEDAKKKRYAQYVERNRIPEEKDLKKVLTEKSRNIIEDCTHVGTSFARQEASYFRFIFKFCRLVAARVSTIFMRTGCEISYLSVRSYKTGKESAHNIACVSSDIYRATKEPVRQSIRSAIFACKTICGKIMTEFVTGCKKTVLSLGKYGKKGIILLFNAVLFTVKKTGEVFAFLLLKAAELLEFMGNAVKKEIPVLIDAVKEQSVTVNTARELT